MSEVDVSKLREGDVVTVRAILGNRPDSIGELAFRMGGNPRPQFCNVTDIVSVEPRPLKVGDRVKAAEACIDEATLLCIHGGSAWISLPSGSHLTTSLSSLSPA